MELAVALAAIPNTKGPLVQRKPLKHMDYEVDLESRLGKTQVSLGAVTSIIDGLKSLYTEKLRPLDTTYRFHDFVSPPLATSDFDAKPMVMLLGQYSTGKTTFIKHLLKCEYPGAHVGPEPTTDRFVVVMGDGDLTLPSMIFLICNLVFITKNDIALELFLVKREIKGPSRLAISKFSKSPSHQRVSWCKSEITVDFPEDIFVAPSTKNTVEVPHVIVTAINLKTIISEKHNVNEIVSASIICCNKAKVKQKLFGLSLKLYKATRGNRY